MHRQFGPMAICHIDDSCRGCFIRFVPRSWLSGSSLWCLVFSRFSQARHISASMENNVMPGILSCKKLITTDEAPIHASSSVVQVTPHRIQPMHASSSYLASGSGLFSYSVFSILTNNPPRWIGLPRMFISRTKR